MTIELLDHWVAEREAIRLRRALGRRKPWTEDKILQSWRFCNVRREDDAVTIWIRDNIRRYFANDQNLWLMLCIARLINHPDTLAELIDETGWPQPDGSFDIGTFEAVLGARTERGDKVYTSAYITHAPPEGGEKYIHTARLVQNLWEIRDEFHDYCADMPRMYMQSIHGWLKDQNGFGDFMAYQCVVDMRFTRYLQNAPDRDSWCACGPGTLRGIDRLKHGGKLTSDRIPYQQDFARGYAIGLYEGLCKRFPAIKLDLSDVPNILCEYDKYMRVLNGEGTPRQKYPGAQEALF